MTSRRRDVTFSDLIDAGILEIGDGYRARIDELGGDGPIFLRAGRLTRNGFDWTNPERFRSDARDRLSSKLGRVGDTVITTKGNSIGRAGFVEPGAPEFVYSPHLSYWRSRDYSELVPGYLRYWARGPEFTSQLQALGHSTDMAPYLSLSDQHRLKISLPSVEEQISVSEVLGALDDKIATNDGMARTAEELASSLAQATPRRVPLGSLVSYVREQVSPAGINTHFVEHYSIPAFDARRLPEIAAPSTIKSIKFAVPPGAILISRLNPATPRVWDARPSGERPALASTEFLVLLPREDISSAELWAVCTQSDFTDQLASKVTGTSNSHQRARPEDILAAAVRDPRALSPDHRALIGTLADRAAAARSESESLAQIRDALLPRLMSGEIRVREAEKVGEVL